MFASCIYCGWRLDGEVRGAIEDAIILPSSSLSPSPAATPVSKVGGVGARSGGVTSTHADRDKLNKCGHCLKPLPRCSICLMLLGSGMDVSPAEVDSPIANRRSDANKTETPWGGVGLFLHPTSNDELCVGVICKLDLKVGSWLHPNLTISILWHHLFA